MLELYEIGCSILIVVCDSCYAGWPRRITSVEDGRMSGRGWGERGWMSMIRYLFCFLSSHDVASLLGHMPQSTLYYRNGS